MDQVKKSDLLKYAKNEYFATILAAKVARRLHATQPEKRPDPKAKVTSLALKLITSGSVEYTSPPPQERPAAEPEAAQPEAAVEAAPDVSAADEPKVEQPKAEKPKASRRKAEATEEA